VFRTLGVCGGIAAAALAVTGCASSSTAWLKNDSDTVMRVRFWCGPRDMGHDPTTLKPGEVHDVLPGKTVTLQLDEECGFVSNSASIVRIQAEPLGVSFKRIVQYWFEVNPPGPYGVKAVGVRPDIRAERDGTGTMVSVPMEFWPAPQE
jgi:hypothetical protein